MNADIDDLRTLVELVEAMTCDSARSWSEYARILCVDDGTLSSRIDKLSREFKRRIVDRAGRFPVVTEEGVKLYELVKTFLAAADGKRLVENLNVQVADSILAEIMPGAVRDFLTMHRGEVALRFRRLNYFSIRNDVMNRRVAFGIGWSFLAEQSELIVPLEPACDLAIITPSDHAFSTTATTAITPEALRDEMVFLLQPELRMRKINQLLEHVPPEHRIECTNYHTVLAYTRAGLGIGIVPAWRWILDELREQKAIGYLLLPKKYRQHIVAFLPKGGIKVLSKHASHLYQAIQRTIAGLNNRA